MANVWLTYSWNDNETGDVDYIAQELVQAGLEIRLDRWNIGAGTRLWEQIDRFISDPNESDAWLLFATENSLSSEACKEEYAYALDRALNTRGDNYPVIALFSGEVSPSLIPAGIRIRLFVSLTDPDWKERIKAAAEGRALQVEQRLIEPYDVQYHLHPSGKNVIEVRPRVGVWTPFFAAIPIEEKEKVGLGILRGPRGRLPQGGVLHMTSTGPSEDNKWWMKKAADEATSATSYFVFCDEFPSVLRFGVEGGTPQYEIRLDQIRGN